MEVRSEFENLKVIGSRNYFEKSGQARKEEKRDDAAYWAVESVNFSTSVKLFLFGLRESFYI